MRDPNLSRRQTTARFGRAFLFLSLVISIVSLVVLFVDIGDQAAGYVVRQNSTDPATLSSKPIEQLTEAELALIIDTNLTARQVDAVLAESLDERGRAGTLKLVQDDVLGPIDPRKLTDTPLEELDTVELNRLLSDNLTAERIEQIVSENTRKLEDFDQPQLLELVQLEVLGEVSASQMADLSLDSLTSEELIQIIEGNFGPKRIEKLSKPNYAELSATDLSQLIIQELLPALDPALVSQKPVEELSKEELLALLNDYLGPKRLEGLTVSTLDQLDAATLAGLVRAELAMPVDPATITSESLDKLDTVALIDTLRAKVGKTRFSILVSKGLEIRGREYMVNLIKRDVLRPTVKESWGLWRSLTDKAGIEREVATRYPGAKVEWKSWLSPQFLQTVMNSEPELAGIRTALLGSLWMIALTILIAVPLGVGAAIYLEEFGGRSALSKLIQINIYNLAGVPSIIYGMLGLTIFVRGLETFTSGQIFGITDSNGRTIISAAFTMALLILPLIIINTQEALRAVPRLLHEASYGIGMTKLETIWHHILPSALPGILTGTILAMSRAVGETAPLIVIGASTFIALDPNGPFSKFTVLPIQIYTWTAQPSQAFRNIAAAAIVVLLVLLISLNLTAILLRNKYRKES